MAFNSAQEGDSNESNNRTPERADVDRLRSTVRSRCDAALNEQDVEDVTSEVLEAACVSATNQGKRGCQMAVAFGYARKGRYYGRSAEAVKARRAALAREAGTCGVSERLMEVRHSHDQFRAADVRAVVGTLTDREADVLWRCDAEGCTLAQVAASLGVCVATVDRILKRARNQFRAAWAA